MGKRNHAADLTQRLLGKKRSKKVLSYGKRMAESGKKKLNQGVEGFFFGKKRRKR